MVRKNNRGFSLVEVIIILAIMVTFLMLLLPMYFKYIEKSKEATDVTNLKNIYTAAEAMLANGEYVPGGSYVYVNECLALLNDNAYSYGVGTSTNGGTLYVEEDGTTTEKYDPSKSYKDGYAVVVFPTESDQDVTVYWVSQND